CVAGAGIASIAAWRGRGKAATELHRGEDRRGKAWTEEHPRRGARARAVARGERSVAKHAVFVEIVGDGHVEDLIEIPQLPRRTLQNHETQHSECKAAEE